MVIQKETGELWKILSEIPDPEIPVINLVELGVIRKVEENREESRVIVTITPTYTGCPAKKLFNDLIIEKLHANGYQQVEVISQLYPVWTTDWLSEASKAKLLKEGISPPTVGDKIVQCPRCKSADTRMISAFGSTPCQSMHQCNHCQEPFNYFKCY